MYGNAILSGNLTTIAVVYELEAAFHGITGKNILRNFICRKSCISKFGGGQLFVKRTYDVLRGEVMKLVCCWHIPSMSAGEIEIILYGDVQNIETSERNESA